MSQRLKRSKRTTGAMLMNAVDLNAVANSLWRRMLPGLRANMPEDIGADYFDGFVRRNGGAIVSVMTSGDRSASSWSMMPANPKA